MSTYIGGLTSGSSTGSPLSIKTMGQNFQTALSGFNWVRDLNVTGQTFYADDYTIAATGIPTTGAGLNYQIWHMSDSIHSGSFPVYLKWGISKNTNSNLVIEFQVGTGVIENSTDITPATYKLRLHNSNTSDTVNTASSSHFCGNSGAFACSLNNSVSTNVGRFFSIERSYNTNGQETNEYVTICGSYYDNAASTIVPIQFSLNSTGGFTPLISTRLAHLCPTATAHAASFNGNTYISPVFPLLGFIGNPLKNVAVTKNTTLNNGGIFQGIIYNTSNNYIAFNQNNAFLGLDGDATNRPTSTIMRWE